MGVDRRSAPIFLFPWIDRLPPPVNTRVIRPRVRTGG
jgi:hypothetical protein